MRNLNTSTSIVIGIITVFTLGACIVSIFGLHLPSSVTNNYIRQAVTARPVQGGGLSFGK